MTARKNKRGSKKTWGGARPGAGAKPTRGKRRKKLVALRLSDETFEELTEIAESVQEAPATYVHDLVTADVERRKAAKKKRRRKRK